MENVLKLRIASTNRREGWAAATSSSHDPSPGHDRARPCKIGLRLDNSVSNVFNDIDKCQLYGRLIKNYDNACREKTDFYLFILQRRFCVCGPRVGAGGRFARKFR